MRVSRFFNDLVDRYTKTRVLLFSTGGAKMLTVKEAAEYIASVLERPSFPVATVRTWINTGKLPAKKVGRNHYIIRADLEKILAGPGEHTNQGV
jgi:excisionase family DNA binding protein